MITMIMMMTVMTMMVMMIMRLMVVMMEPVLTSHELVFWVLQTHSVPTCSILFSSISQKKPHLLNHLVLGVDESIVDAFGAVAEVEDGVDFLSTVEGFRGGNFTHALGIQGLFTAKANLSHRMTRVHVLVNSFPGYKPGIRAVRAPCSRR